MPTEQHLRIGGHHLCLRWDDAGDEAQQAFPLYAPFAATGAADLTLRIQRATAPWPAAVRELDQFPHWRRWRTADGYLYEVFASQPPHQRLHWALVNATVTEGVVMVESGGASLGRLLEPLGQVLLVERWRAAEAVMAHALAVDDHGVGRVFIGHSGAGKSTLARWYQADGATVLSDERVVLQLDGDRLLAYGTPWPGMAWSGASGPAEVETLYCLQQALQHTVEPLAPGEAVALLYPQLFLLSRDRAEEVEPALRWCEQVLARLPVARLAFAKDASVVDYVRSTASQIAARVIR